MLKSAQARLDKLKSGPRAEEIAEAEGVVKFAQGNLLAQTAAVSIAQDVLEVTRADLKNAEDGVEVAHSGLATARAAVNTAQTNLDKLLSRPTSQEIRIAEAKVERAKNVQAGLEEQRDDSLNLIEGYIEAARNDTRIAELQLELLEAGARPEDIAAARAQVSQANGGLQVAQGEVAQADALLAEVKAALQVNEARLNLSTAQREEAEFQLAQAQAQQDLVKAGSRAEDIAIAQASVAQAEAALAKARRAREDTVLRAPFSGTVGEILIEQGETALPQAPALLIGDMSQLLVKTEDLSQTEIVRITVGQEARITVDALDGQSFGARVLRLAPMASELRGDKVYVVTLMLDATLDAGLRWGMSAFVEINTR